MLRRKFHCTEMMRRVRTTRRQVKLAQLVLKINFSVAATATKNGWLVMKNNSIQELTIIRTDVVQYLQIGNSPKLAEKFCYRGPFLKPIRNTAAMAPSGPEGGEYHCHYYRFSLYRPISLPFTKFYRWIYKSNCEFRRSICSKHILAIICKSDLVTQI